MLKVVKEAWLKREADKVEGVLLITKNAMGTYTRVTIITLMEGVGVTYTTDQMDDIIGELLDRKILEEG